MPPFETGSGRIGGRQKGVPNKATTAIREKLAEHADNIIDGMLALALDENNSPEVRLRAYAELLQYLVPKLRAVEHSGQIDSEQVIHAGGSAIERLKARIDEIAKRNREMGEEKLADHHPNGTGNGNGHRE